MNIHEYSSFLVIHHELSHIFWPWSPSTEVNHGVSTCSPMENSAEIPNGRRSTPTSSELPALHRCPQHCDTTRPWGNSWVLETRCMTNHGIPWLRSMVSGFNHWQPWLIWLNIGQWRTMVAMWTVVTSTAKPWAVQGWSNHFCSFPSQLCLAAGKLPLRTKTIKNTWRMAGSHETTAVTQARVLPIDRPCPVTVLHVLRAGPNVPRFGASNPSRCPALYDLHPFISIHYGVLYGIHSYFFTYTQPQLFMVYLYNMELWRDLQYMELCITPQELAYLPMNTVPCAVGELVTLSSQRGMADLKCIKMIKMYQSISPLYQYYYIIIYIYIL